MKREKEKGGKSDRETETERQGETEPEHGGGQVGAILAGTVCAVPDRVDMAVAGISEQSAAEEHHDQTAAQLKPFLSTLGERSW